MTENGEQIEWREFHGDEVDAVRPVDGRRRLRFWATAFIVVVACVFGRLAMLEAKSGPTYRAEAAKPLVRRESLAAPRGRILARDGTVLAYDRTIPALAVHYRYLESPHNPRWLRLTALSRLTRAERRLPEAVAAEEARLRVELADFERRLAALCELSLDEWRSKAAAIQARVERIAEHVNDAHRAEAQVRAKAADSERDTSWWMQAARTLLVPSGDEASTSRITVAEELDYHVMLSGLPLDVVAEIEAHPDAYPGVRIATELERAYPVHAVAAHVVGHLGPTTEAELNAASEDDLVDPYEPTDRVGRVGVERQYEASLRGRRGMLVEHTDHSGRVVRSVRQREPQSGRDVVLTIDPALQRTAESLLDSTLKRRPAAPGGARDGGAVVVIDVRRGEILAAASAPRFDPNVFSSSDGAEAAALLSDPSRPLFDRVAQMAIAPGSVYKIVAAMALLESETIDGHEHFHCQGYLHWPDRQRCLLFKQRGIGHGDVTLVDALAQSCNVYFFHHADLVGPAALVDWSLRLGFGQATGCDLPSESDGRVPTPMTIRELEEHGWRDGDTQSLAIGQGSLTATPLQVARLLAAVANGGRLVTPHVARDIVHGGARTEAEVMDDSAAQPDITPPREIENLRAETLNLLRQGLEHVVLDPAGTGYETVRLASVPIAGKTGTAETGTTADGAPRDDHAWFAGYAPADDPKVAVVVALEHGGSGSLAAGPVAKRVVARLDELGYLSRRGQR